LREVAAYSALSGEIQAAAEVLQAHRGEFEALTRDAEAVSRRARELFAEQDFAPLFFTIEDVQRAFENVGYPSRRPHEAQQASERLLAAMLFLADHEYRVRATVRLMTLLPKYVAAGRYFDAWLIQFNALWTLQAPQESNPLLGELFYQGLVQWAETLDAQQQAAMGEVGIDRARLAGMGLDEAEAWLTEQMADPGKTARLGAYLAAHPMMRAQAEAELAELEDGALRLFDRDDADALYLSQEEVEPWLPVLVDRVQPCFAQIERGLKRGEAPDEATREKSAELLFQVAREMAQAIFTPERIRRLLADLRDYCRRLHQAGEREACAYAQAAVMALQRDQDPAENPLLLAICYTSLRSLLHAAAERGRADAENEADAGEGKADDPTRIALLARDEERR